MKRMLFVVTAVVTAITIGLSGLTSAVAAQPKTNAAAVRTTKTFVSEMNKDEARKLYLGFAPNQRKLFTRKQFTKCFGPSLTRTKSVRWLRLLDVTTSTKTTVPGYRGKRLTNKRVLFKWDAVYGGKHHRANTYLDVVYVSGAWHWWFTAAEIRQCKSV